MTFNNDCWLIEVRRRLLGAELAGVRLDGALCKVIECHADLTAMDAQDRGTAHPVLPVHRHGMRQ